MSRLGWAAFGALATVAIGVVWMAWSFRDLIFDQR